MKDTYWQEAKTGKIVKKHKKPNNLLNLVIKLSISQVRIQRQIVDLTIRMVRLEHIARRKYEKSNRD